MVIFSVFTKPGCYLDQAFWKRAIATASSHVLANRFGNHKMSDFFWNTITENMKFILNGISQSEVGKHFYLAGGTALALQIGHRYSVDLDFFSPTEDIPTVQTLRGEILFTL
jgi:predicted nucleotidyltransferase component of viral defense system